MTPDSTAVNIGPDGTGVAAGANEPVQTPAEEREELDELIRAFLTDSKTMEELAVAAAKAHHTMRGVWPTDAYRYADQVLINWVEIRDEKSRGL